MDTIRNVTQMLIGGNVASTKVQGDVINSIADLPAGEVVIATPQNVVVDGAEATPPTLVKFIYHSASVGELIHSDLIDLKNNLRGYNIGTAEDEAQQLNYVGLDPSVAVNAGSIPLLANNIYTIRLYILDKTTAGFMQQKVKEGFYKSGSTTPTQDEVALGLVASLTANYSRETEQDIKFDAVTNDNGTGQNTATIDVVSGSKYITATDALVVGEAIRFQEGAALENTDHVYKIVGSPDTNIYELDRAYNGPTQTLAIGAADIGIVLTGDWGVRIWGVDREFKKGHYWSNVAFWEVQADFSETASPQVTEYAAYPGVGTGDYIANLEFELQHDESIYRGFPEAGVVNRADAVEGNTGLYDVQVNEHDHKLDAAQGTPTHSPKALMIAWYAGAAQNATVVGYWEALLAALGVPYTGQAANLT